MLRIDSPCECMPVVVFGAATNHQACLGYFFSVSASSIFFLSDQVLCRYDDSVLANVRRLQAAYGAPVARKGKAKLR